jgi:hypothetical protein
LWSFFAKHKFAVVCEDQPDKSDKSEFIQAALRRVQDDLQAAKLSNCVRGQMAAKTRSKRGTSHSLSPDDAAGVVLACRRRCCLCSGLNHDTSEKKGHLAHLDHDRSNNAIENFVFLCQSHHDTYDSKTRLTKNYTQHEVRRYQKMLHEAVARGEVPSDQVRKKK